MKIAVNNKRQILSVGLSDIGSYLNLEKPISITWFDCCGSLGQYLSILSNSKSALLQIQTKLSSDLYKDYSNDLNQLVKVLEPFLGILINDEYSISFHNEESKLLNSAWSIETTEQTELQSELKFEKEYSSDDSFKNNLLNSTTHSIYGPNKTMLIATIPTSVVDSERVKQFEQEIIDGRRPFAIIIGAYYQNDADVEYSKLHDDFDADWDSNFYILDGHHKLQAYKNLDIKPPLALIYKQYNSMLETKFDYNLIKKSMFRWQSDHLYEKWEGKDKYENGNRIKY